MNTQLADRVQQWLDHDPDERTCAELSALLENCLLYTSDAADDLLTV